MRFVLYQAAAGCFWVHVAALPVLAQVDSLGGAAGFRSADGPISAPSLRSAESASPDTGKSLASNPPAPEAVLKQIDKELGRTGTRSTSGTDQGTLGSPQKADDRSGFGNTIGK
jgi:hypothetical protein